MGPDLRVCRPASATLSVVAAMTSDVPRAPEPGAFRMSDMGQAAPGDGVRRQPGA
jgi:hypothetical protein